MKKLIPIIGVALLTSCSVHREIQKDTKAHDPQINASSFGMVIKPIVADLKVESVKQSVTYTADLKLPLSELKDNAMELFLTTHKCDYVVDPVFSRVTTVENSRLSEIKITLTGFPATYSKVYQVDSLPKSVMQYSSISLPVKRVEYTNSIISETKGKSFGMEFYTGFVPSGVVGVQLDYAKNVNGLHYYLAVDRYSTPGTVEFDYAVSVLNKKSGKISYDHTAISFGVFKEKSFSNRFKIRGAGGINYSSMPFVSSFKNTADKTSFNSTNSLGLRFGAALDYRLYGGISFVGRAHANVALRNAISQDGEYTSKISNIRNSDYPLLNISAGFRFNF
ncbi:MAG: hypothetical protein ACK5CL_06095 [Sphingomonadales bacterium]|jgi:hypothetical protein